MLLALCVYQWSALATNNNNNPASTEEPLTTAAPLPYEFSTEPCDNGKNLRNFIDIQFLVDFSAHVYNGMGYSVQYASSVLNSQGEDVYYWNDKPLEEGVSSPTASQHICLKTRWCSFIERQMGITEQCTNRTVLVDNMAILDGDSRFYALSYPVMSCEGLTMLFPGYEDPCSIPHEKFEYVDPYLAFCYDYCKDRDPPADWAVSLYVPACTALDPPSCNTHSHLKDTVCNLQHYKLNCPVLCNECLTSYTGTYPTQSSISSQRSRRNLPTINDATCVTLLNKMMDVTVSLDDNQTITDACTLIRNGSFHLADLNIDAFMSTCHTQCNISDWEYNEKTMITCWGYGPLTPFMNSIQQYLFSPTPLYWDQNPDIPQLCETLDGQFSGNCVFGNYDVDTPPGNAKPLSELVPNYCTSTTLTTTDTTTPTETLTLTPTLTPTTEFGVTSVAPSEFYRLEFVLEATALPPATIKSELRAKIRHVIGSSPAITIECVPHGGTAYRARRDTGYDITVYLLGSVSTDDVEEVAQLTGVNDQTLFEGTATVAGVQTTPAPTTTTTASTASTAPRAPAPTEAPGYILGVPEGIFIAIVAVGGVLAISCTATYIRQRKHRDYQPITNTAFHFNPVYNRGGNIQP